MLEVEVAVSTLKNCLSQAHSSDSGLLQKPYAAHTCMPLQGVTLQASYLAFLSYTEVALMRMWFVTGFMNVSHVNAVFTLSECDLHLAGA